MDIHIEGYGEPVLINGRPIGVYRSEVKGNVNDGSSTVTIFISYKHEDYVAWVPPVVAPDPTSTIMNDERAITA